MFLIDPQNWSIWKSLLIVIAYWLIAYRYGYFFYLPSTTLRPIHSHQPWCSFLISGKICDRARAHPRAPLAQPVSEWNWPNSLLQPPSAQTDVIARLLRNKCTSQFDLMTYLRPQNVLCRSGSGVAGCVAYGVLLLCVWGIESKTRSSRGASIHESKHAGWRSAVHSCLSG